MSDPVKLTTPKEIFELRNELLEQYGDKIIYGKTEQMTPKEKEANENYVTLTDVLHHLAPHTAITDRFTHLYARIGKLFHKGKVIVFHDL